MRVELRIERVVIEGVEFSPAQSRRLKLALARRLTDELARGGLGPSLTGRGGAVPRLTAPAPVPLTAAPDPRTLATGIANGVRGALAR